MKKVPDPAAKNQQIRPESDPHPRVQCSAQRMRLSMVILKRYDFNGVHGKIVSFLTHPAFPSVFQFKHNPDLQIIWIS